MKRIRSQFGDVDEIRTRIPFSLETFLARQQRDGRHVPRFVEREIRALLECGILAHGFLRVHCDSCGKDTLVPFSSKGRGFCPSCCGRRMADTAAHLVDRVFPEVAIRQWVLSLPYALRYRPAYDADGVTAVLGVFVRTIFGFLKRRAKDYGIDRAQCGAVTFVQRFGGSLNANVHFHTLVIEGVYAPKPDSAPEFFPLRAPETTDIERLFQVLAMRIPALLERREGDSGYDQDEGSDRLEREEPWLSGVYVASVTGRIATGPRAGERVETGGDRIDPETLDAGLDRTRRAE